MKIQKDWESTGERLWENVEQIAWEISGLAIIATYVAGWLLARATNRATEAVARRFPWEDAKP